MKDKIFGIVIVVFAFFVTVVITSCQILTEVPVNKKLSANDKALLAVNEEWSGKIECESIDGMPCAVVDNKATIFSKKLTPVEGGKKYVLSGSFKSLGNVKSKVYYGFICYDKKKRPICTINANVILDSETRLAEACKKGDKVLVLKANKKWKKGNYAVAFNAKDDFSDLPNREVVFKITKIVSKKDGNMELQLFAPVKKSYLSGTKVRMHTSACGSYVYTAIVGAAVPKTWNTYSGSATLAKPGQIGWQYIRPGTAFVRVVILPNYNKEKDEKLAFKDLSLNISE